MNKIECGFCHKNVIFNDDDAKKSGQAKLLRCEHCSRSITIQFKDKKYYEEIEK